MKTVIVAAFPGMGKTYMSKVGGNKKCLDLDSSRYHWIWKDGKQTAEENPDFIRDYLAAIVKELEDQAYDAVFISSHDKVRKALKAANIRYFLVFPYYGDRKYYIDMYRKRGNSERFIKRMDKNYCGWVEAMDREKYPYKVKLKAGEFITEELITWMQNYDEVLKHTTLADLISGDPMVHVTAICQNHYLKSSEIRRIGDKMDWDTYSMYGKPEEEILKEFPMNWYYVEKYHKLLPKLKRIVDKRKRERN